MLERKQKREEMTLFSGVKRVIKYMMEYFSFYVMIG